METPSTDPVLSDRIKAIVGTEKHIDDMMRCARELMNDLAKEKQISKNKMEDNANTFKRLITQVENELSSQMQYLSHVCVGSSHQGSTFGTLQNSLLAQSGCSSLHSDLADILSSLNPPPPTPEAVEIEEDGPSTARTEQTMSPSDGAASAPPRSQEERQEEPEGMEE